MSASATHPRDVLFADGDLAPQIPVCDHYCGIEERMVKSLQLQAELGPVFDITFDCEDGAPVGSEKQHVRMVADLTIVFDRGIGVDDDVDAQPGARIDDGAGENLQPSPVTYVRRDDRAGMDDVGEHESGGRPHRKYLRAPEV